MGVRILTPSAHLSSKSFLDQLRMNKRWLLNSLFVNRAELICMSERQREKQTGDYETYNTMPSIRVINYKRVVKVAQYKTESWPDSSDMLQLAG